MNLQSHQIADEALDLIDATHDHIGWLTALMTAIRADAKHNLGRDLEKFTGLGQFLGSDWEHYLDGQSKRCGVSRMRWRCRYEYLQLPA